MLRAKLLNRSGCQMCQTLHTKAVVVLLLLLSATGNAQQAMKLTSFAHTKTNQQPQHRVSVAPQGGELGKKTGANSASSSPSEMHPIWERDPLFPSLSYSWINDLEGNLLGISIEESRWARAGDCLGTGLGKNWRLTKETSVFLAGYFHVVRYCRTTPSSILFPKKLKEKS